MENLCNRDSLETSLDTLPLEYRLLLWEIFSSFNSKDLHRLYSAITKNEGDVFNAVTTEMVRIKEGQFYFNNKSAFDFLEADEEMCSKWTESLKKSLECISFSSRKLKWVREVIGIILDMKNWFLDENGIGIDPYNNIPQMELFSNSWWGHVMWGIEITMERILQGGNTHTPNIPETKIKPTEIQYFG